MEECIAFTGGKLMKKVLLVSSAIVLAPMLAFAQDPAQVQRLFEAGQYQQVVEATSAEANPQVLYVAAQSHQKLGATDQALELYRQLASRGEDDVWHFIGLAAQQLTEDQVDAARESAQRAVDMAGDVAEAHFQLGLVNAKRQDWQAAARAFDRAAELNPSLAYAHYYGGLMHYRANRPDQMAIHFEEFLRLAPDAPERPEVLQIMRTVRGR